ncbi:hypothetical protein Val02_48010 [Virgisporangium aliadipatigenens]|uniref:non-specific serine/threonine protein kinase n=1 Tax=Virgisporangium aliadipatigenens TaxID=741659 RepID=A0A8J3YQ36_9ACTN|nr:hypothetical protein Val02_48010 [Virgisporangium aliadipatigenens]
MWRAHDDVLNRAVAIKVLAPGQHVDAAARARVQAEARAAAALSHPNVAAVHDYGEAADPSGEPLPYVVMELVDGPTLTEVLDDGPVGPADAMRICADVAAGLAAAHARGLVHRDVKPGNVIVTPGGAKLVDFGIAAAVGEPDETDGDGLMYGTPAYLAPERLEDGVVVAGSDVYALGLLLYRMLTGRTPWSVQTTTQMLRAHAYVKPKPLPAVEGVPEEIAQLCRRCLAKDPEDRPTAAEAAAFLSAAARDAQAAGSDTAAPRPAAGLAAAPTGLATGAGGAASDAEPTGPTVDVAASRRRRLTVLALVVALMVTGLFLVALRRSGWPPPGPGHAEPGRGVQSGVEPAQAGPTAGGGSGGASAAANGGGSAGPSGPGGASPGAPVAPPAGATNGPTGGAGPTAPATPGTAPPPARRTADTTGGSAVFECTASGAYVVSWEPDADYETQNVQRGPGQKVHVMFKSGNRHVKIEAGCVNGVPDITIK